MGRFAEPALWIVVALQQGPQSLRDLLDEVRRLDGPAGHGTLLAAVVRLERRAIVERVPGGRTEPAWRLTSRASESRA